MTKRSRGRRTTPRGTRPSHLRPVEDLAPPTSPVDEIIDKGGQELLAADDPLRAEAWASHLLGIFDSMRRQAQVTGDQVPPFDEAIVERCGQRTDRRALAVAAALAAVVPPPLDEPARTVARQLARSTTAPAWAEQVGQAEPTRAWLASDVFGDQDSLIVGFSTPGRGDEHALVVLVDHNLAGQAKDAWIGGDVDDVAEAWRSVADRHMRVEEIPVPAALDRLRDSVAASDLWTGDAGLRTEDFADHRALLWSRLRRVGYLNDPATDVAIEDAERSAIVADFLASEPATAAGGALEGADVGLLARHLVDLRADDEGRPLRWSPTVVRMVLTDLAPRRLVIDPVESAHLPAVLRAFVRFAAGRTGLAAEFVEEILAAVDEFEPVFIDRMGDPSTAGPAKAVLAALGALGVPLDDADAVRAALEDLDQHQPQTGQPGAKRRRKPAGAPEEVVEAAAATPVVARFDVLAGFYGNGRKLTQKGHPTLADARSLVGLLGTHDRIDETIGDRTFKTRSAAELPELRFTIRWALAGGALRKEHGRLRATAAWRKLESKPLDRWLKAADALLSLGPLTAYYERAPLAASREFLDEVLPEVLEVLQARAVPLDTVLDAVCEQAELGYEWLSPYMQDPEHRRTSFGHDLDRLVMILGWAGVVERAGATAEPDRWAPSGERLVGGTLRLTALGRWWSTTLGL